MSSFWKRVGAALAAIATAITAYVVSQNPQPVPTPSPSPVISAEPSLEPSATTTTTLTPESPSPSPIVSPGACYAPQEGNGGVWVAAGRDVDPAPETDPDTLAACDAVNLALVSLGGCGGVGGRCDLVPQDRQVFFRTKLIPKLQAMGWCAGQHINGHTEEISLALPENWPQGPWYNFHAFNGGGSAAVWCKPDQPNEEGRPGRGSWRGPWTFAPDGTPIPSPEPEPLPTATPRPTPPPNIRVEVTATGLPARPGATITLTCRANGEPRAADTWFVGAQLGGLIKRQHFTVVGNSTTKTLRIHGDCPAGRFTAYCVVEGKSSPNLRMEIR